MACLGDGKALVQEPQRTKAPIWEKLYTMIDEYLEGLTLADLCKDNTRSNIVV